MKSDFQIPRNIWNTLITCHRRILLASITRTIFQIFAIRWLLNVARWGLFWINLFAVPISFVIDKVFASAYCMIVLNYHYLKTFCVQEKNQEYQLFLSKFKLTFVIFIHLCYLVVNDHDHFIWVGLFHFRFD